MNLKNVSLLIAIVLPSIFFVQANDFSLTDLVSKIKQDSEQSNDAEITTETISKYFQEGEKGWFWYQELPAEVKEELLEIIKQASEPKKQDPKEVPLSPAWFRENFQYYIDAAIANPNDDEAMRTYLYLEKYQQDRSELFAYKRTSTSYSDPYLDNGKILATSQFGIQKVGVEGEKFKKKILGELSKSFGFYFFFRSDCSFCHQQFPIVDYLTKAYGYEIKAVSLDGKGLSGTRFENDYLVDQGQAASLGVEIVPGLVLFDAETKTSEVITQGLQTVSEIEKRILYAAERKGYINDTEFTQVKGKGFYQSLSGEVMNNFPVPDNAPEEFKRLMLESKKFGNK